MVDGAMEARVGRAAMDVAAREREPAADGELMRRPGRTAQNDFGGKNVSGKARQRGNFNPHKFAQRITDSEVMGRDMERDRFHDE